MIKIDGYIFLLIFSILLQSMMSLCILRKMMFLNLKQYDLLLFVLLHPVFVIHMIFLLKMANVFLILGELLVYVLFVVNVVDKNDGVSLFYSIFTLTFTYIVQEFVARLIMHGVFSINYNMIAIIIGYVSAIPIYCFIAKCMSITPCQLIITQQVVDRYQTEIPMFDSEIVQENDIKKEQHRLIIFFNIVMLSCYSYSNYANFTSYDQKVKVNGIVLSCILLVIFILYVVKVKYKEWENQTLINYKHYLVLGLTTYIQEVEQAYQSVRAFHHDFTNILLSMQETISTKEVGEIRKMYAEILKHRHIIFVEHKQEVAKLSNVKILEIKSVIAAKILQADLHGISIELEISEEIEHVPVDKIYIVRLLGIMLDNAIDEVLALDSVKPVIRLAIFDKDRSKYFVVENNMRQEKLPTHLILERGYSTKGSARGHGLANLEMIVTNYPWVSYHIQAKYYRYRIELEMRRN